VLFPPAYRVAMPPHSSRDDSPASARAPLAWHTLGQAEVLSHLGLASLAGLSEAQAVERLLTHGANRLPPAPRRPAWLRFLLQFHNPLIYVLLVAGAITLLLGHRLDAGVIAGVVLINALIGHIQEGKAERALDAVRGMLAERATVVRDGERRQIDAANLVPGDVVWLESGDKVPADLRLCQVRNLRVNESALTGESAPVEKDAACQPEATALGDRRGMAHSGTLVASGQALAVVVATGADTEIGRIGILVGEVHTLATPLTRRLDQFARQITLAILGVALVTVAYGHFVARMPLLDLFLAVVGLAVAAIPEGMPAVVTIVLAMGTRAMAARKAIVRRLPAVETLGSVSVICSDKTGTLTRNEMTAVRVVLPGGELRVSGSGHAPEGGFHRGEQVLEPLAEPALERLLQTAVLCNDARLLHDEAQGWSLVGDPTEGALLTLAHKAGLEQAQLQAAFPRLDALPFESERQYMLTLNHDHAGQRFLCLKGAPERVLDLCVAESGGGALDPDRWHAAVRDAADAGQRVLGLARCSWTEGRAEIGVGDVGARFEWLGLVGIIDPPRPEAIAAVAECLNAGVRVKMITGDHGVTAAAIGRQLGLGAREAITGDMIDRMDDATLGERVRECDVFARATPEHKLRLIAALQAQGQLVAMTGDGVNDAPALKLADIGVAMGGKGTDAAREASDLVLTDDNFATIARAVREGRVVFDNIKKSLMHMLPTNGGEAGVILLAIFAGLPLPVSAGQILWVNTVTSVTLALSLAFEPAERGVMALPPRPAGEPLVTRVLAGRILYVIVLMVAMAFFVFQWELAQGASLELARTAAVNMIVACVAFYLFNVRHYTEPALRRDNLGTNPVAWLVVALLVCLQLLFTYAPPLQQLFQSEALGLRSWAMILGLGMLLFVAVELEKAWLRHRRVLRF